MAMTKDKATSRRERIHEAGATRHGAKWYAANLAAVHATFGFGLNDEQLKEMLPLVVLRVLDTTRRERA